MAIKVKVSESVFIGSKGRLLFPVSKLISGATLFVEPQEYDDYNMLHGKNFTIVKLPENDKGFAYLLNQMLAYAQEKQFEHFFFCDDDILGFSSKDKISSLNQELCKMIEIADKKNYSQLMMSFKAHNWFYDGLIKERIGAWCFILNKTADLVKVGGYDATLPIYNDWDMSAKLITEGHKTACYYGAMFSHKMKSQKGGAEFIYKKQELLDTAKSILEEKYGKECIKEVDAHGQKEIRFQWSKL